MLQNITRNAPYYRLLASVDSCHFFINFTLHCASAKTTKLCAVKDGHTLSRRARKHLRSRSVPSSPSRNAIPWSPELPPPALAPMDAKCWAWSTTSVRRARNVCRGRRVRVMAGRWSRGRGRGDFAEVGRVRTFTRIFDISIAGSSLSLPTVFRQEFCLRTCQRNESTYKRMIITPNVYHIPPCPTRLVNLTDRASASSAFLTREEKGGGMLKSA